MDCVNLLARERGARTVADGCSVDYPRSRLMEVRGRKRSRAGLLVLAAATVAASIPIAGVARATPAAEGATSEHIFTAFANGGPARGLRVSRQSAGTAGPAPRAPLAPTRGGAWPGTRSSTPASPTATAPPGMCSAHRVRSRSEGAALRLQEQAGRPDREQPGGNQARKRRHLRHFAGCRGDGRRNARELLRLQPRLARRQPAPVIGDERRRRRGVGARRRRRQRRAAAPTGTRQ